jgi:isoleucyl-tRNA synthetase
VSDEAFTPLPRVPDHPALEREVLDWWQEERVFERLREQNRGREPWSFIDGPKTANTVDGLGVHHLWGRTYKDVFQRYKALRGFDQRYQNGFDCQGLWVEVKVERDLGLNSKREIEDYGLAEFARRCRELVAESARVITSQSIRLGQWMDWGTDYYTFSDTNIEYIWRFLKTVDEQGWLYQGHRSTEWCPRCGTSISQHELSQAEVYRERSDPSLFVRFPLRARDGQALVVWTTTPWTLPANVAAAVHPEAEYGRRDDGDWVAVARYPDDDFEEVVRGAELVGLEYEGPFDHFPTAAADAHRVIPWEDVSLEEGTGIVHIAPGAGTEDFELSRVHDLPVLVPVDESGRFLPGYGWLHGTTTGDAAEQIVSDLRERGLLVEHGTYLHRYPHCWRCGTPLIFRVVDDWFVAVDELRPKLLEANASVRWTPDFYGKRMDDWLRNMGDWNISRKRYFGLPLPFYPCERCGKVTVIGSLDELRERATSGLDQLEELHRPWVDGVTISCSQCGEEVRRVPEVGDVWLDAGIVPFSTLGWRHSGWLEEGYATGAARGLTRADLPDHAYWETWFPADWVTEMREQIRLWFYSLLFMSVVFTGRAPFEQVLGHEDVRDERGHEMHGSKGNTIEANEALEHMGADVMRWMYCAQPPTQGVKFGYGPAGEIKGRLLRLWNSVKFFVDYANVDRFRPGPVTEASSHALDTWLGARTRQLVREATEAYERFWTPAVVDAFDRFVDDLSNWYIRRSRRRFWTSDAAALQTLWQALVTAVRVIGPVMPFLSDYLWRILRAEDAPASVFLAGWPEVATEPGDEELLAEAAEVRRVVELGRKARGDAGIKLRQPLARIVVAGAARAARHRDEIAEELRVKDVSFEAGGGARVRFKPNLRVLGPRLGKRLPEVRRALDEGRYEVDGDRIVVDGEVLGRDDVLEERLPVREGWVVAADGDLSVELDPSLDPELELEGRVLDLIHALNGMRKDAGLELTDRIRVTLPQSLADLLRHEDWIKEEVLAVEIRTDGVAEPQIEKV